MPKDEIASVGPIADAIRNFRRNDPSEPVRVGTQERRVVKTHTVTLTEVTCLETGAVGYECDVDGDTGAVSFMEGTTNPQQDAWLWGCYMLTAQRPGGPS